MPLSPLPHLRGLVLAAGSGSRMGGPKALLRPGGDGPTLVERAVRVLVEGGCDGVTVVVGAAADEVAAVLTALTRVAPSSTGPRTEPEPNDGDDVTDLDVVECPDWSEGMGASLRAGLAALLPRHDVEAVVITLVDLPDVGPEVVRRLLGADPAVTTTTTPAMTSTARGWSTELSRAAYGGVPGHPTLIGRNHWQGVLTVARGDRGARDYFRTHTHALVECGDLASGRDVDSPADLDR
ncbi:nucleotidyltransferase family protein [Intrasporangium sp.]|uniref:nucleotidyltransferase family protein n=1 Tax=Intrasporangium sp. TaxID=1925024 RepID=UPI002939A8CA|nr:nucleotidyltransferase family protein [Intrasporangium sp.]MDV3222915.1 nucleotidyltransferase family protein [Intrasporangium sp.]